MSEEDIRERIISIAKKNLPAHEVKEILDYDKMNEQLEKAIPDDMEHDIEYLDARDKLREAFFGKETLEKSP